MRIKPLYKDRYPGLVPFDKGQSTIFFGREQEKKELFYQICLEKIVVLFSKSGLGKSSLLNAGIFPLLEASGYVPVRVRFSSVTDNEAAGENILLRDFKSLLKGEQYKSNIEYNKESPRLWEYIKAVPAGELVSTEAIQEKIPESNESPISKGVRTLNTITSEPVPVFIFDQFEEFFHHPAQHQQEFLSQLAEIVHQETPYRILDWITEIEPEERTEQQVKWSEQPSIKIVFSLRSDALANMQSLGSFIPTVLRNRYELKPLTPDQAAKAITEPAGKNDLGSGYTPPFSFDPGTLNEIIKMLKGNTNEIESSQLQIVCNFIEEKIRKQVVENGLSSPLLVNAAVINPAEDFRPILDSFYESQLNKIEDPNERELARKLIEDNLVINGLRETISKNKLINVFGISEDLIEEIQNTRLIREETTNLGSTYELSHDTLVETVEESKNKRLAKEKEQKEKADQQLLLEEANKNREELIAKREQLTKEMQLRAEAEHQRAEAELQKSEVERLAKKLRVRGFIVFLLVVLFFIGAGWYFNSINNLKQLSLEKELSNKERELSNNKDQFASELTQLTIQNVKTVIGKSGNDQELSDSAKNSILSIIENRDSASAKNNIPKNKLVSQDKAIDSIIEKVFRKELETKVPNAEKLTTTEKIRLLKRVVAPNKALLQFKN